MIRASLTLFVVACGITGSVVADDPIRSLPAAAAQSLGIPPAPAAPPAPGITAEPAPPMPPGTQPLSPGAQPAPSIYSTPGAGAQYQPVPGYMPQGPQPMNSAPLYHSPQPYGGYHDGLPGRHYSFSGAAAMPSASGFGYYDDPNNAFGGYGVNVYTGAIGGGYHPRFPYYSYRAPWYSPGPAGANVNILW
jgi:hypothetical protein